MPGYLEALTLRLAGGVAQLDTAVIDRHVAFFQAAQQADGGFAGRDTVSDLYYTGFAVRGLAFSGRLDEPMAQRVAGYLAQRMQGSAPIVDFFSLLYTAQLLEMATGIDAFAGAHANWREAVRQSLAAYRRDDGGYAKGAEGHKSSTYHTFLVLLCLELIECPPEDRDGIIRFIHSQRREDGGFVEIAPMKRSGTNPTAAALATLRLLDAMDDVVAEEAIDFLGDMQTDEGGLRANTRIPIADLLSTFTGYLSLVDLGGTDAIDAAAAARYVRSLENDQGGFQGAAWDEGFDVEYSFYGLGALALLKNSDVA